MEENRKGLVIAIIVLLVGASVIPSIGGVIETDRKETNEKKSTVIIENPISMDCDKDATAMFTDDCTLYIPVVGCGWVDPFGGVYPAGTVVNLEAFPCIYWEFAFWGGDLSGCENPTTIFMDSDMNIIAHFWYTLPIEIIGCGNVTKNPDQSSYPLGDNVELTAIPDEGWEFAGWSGDIIGSDNPIILVVRDDMIEGVTATFIENTIVSIQPSAQDVEKGEWFDVGIYVEPSELIIGIGVEILYFDPTLIQADRVDCYWTIFDPGTIDNINGKITGIYGFVFIDDAVSDPGYFCNISFIAQQKLGTSPLDIQNVDIINIHKQPLPSTVIDGEVTVGEEETGILYVGGSGPGNYSKIQDAIDNASDGGTVFVFDDSSPYYENIIINKNAINLIGENKDTTIIDANGIGGVVTISAHEISVTGFTIRNSGDLCHGSEGCGIFIGYPYGTRYYYTTIIGNNILNNSAGVLIGCGCEYTNISENSIINNQEWGIGCLQLSSHSTISKNVIANNRGYSGIWVGVSDFNIIEGNIIHDNEGDGVEVESSSDNEIYNNNISNNLGVGIDVEYASPDNFFHHNIFINNNPNADGCAYVNIWDNDYPSGGNFWDDYSGVDYFSGPNQDIPGSDGIGDTYYDIPGCNDKDRYPLMNLSPVFITDVAILTSEPLDTDPGFGWENISCTVTSIIGVDEVKLIVTNPIDAVVEYPMQKLFGTDNYYFNITLTDVGEYEYCIWATDNLVTSASMEFYLPHNADIDMDGECYFYDLGAIVLRYGDTGAPGWIREDVDNDGEVYFYDLGAVVNRYGHWG